MGEKEGEWRGKVEGKNAVTRSHWGNQELVNAQSPGIRQHMHTTHTHRCHFPLLCARPQIVSYTGIPVPVSKWRLAA